MYCVGTWTPRESSQLWWRAWALQAKRHGHSAWIRARAQATLRASAPHVKQRRSSWEPNVRSSYLSKFLSIYLFYPIYLVHLNYLTHLSKSKLNKASPSYLSTYRSLRYVVLYCTLLYFIIILCCVILLILFCFLVVKIQCLKMNCVILYYTVHFLVSDIHFVPTLLQSWVHP